MGPRLAASACYSFSPHMVGAHVPAAWAVASPPQILAARERAVDRMYRALLGDLVDPGVVPPQQWRPEPRTLSPPLVTAWCGVARKR